MLKIGVVLYWNMVAVLTLNNMRFSSNKKFHSRINYYIEVKYIIQWLKSIHKSI